MLARRPRDRAFAPRDERTRMQPTSRQASRHMATSSTTGNLSSTIQQAIATAKDNPQLKQMIEEQIDARKLVMGAAKTGSKAYVRHRKNRKAQLSASAPATGDNAGSDQAEEPSAAPRKKHRAAKGGLVLLAVAGVIAAVLSNQTTRDKLLDALFGAEEEFEYTSTTTTASVNGAG
jgi:hypothetical protein